MPSLRIASLSLCLTACASGSFDGGDTITIAPSSFTIGSSTHARAQALDDAARHGADLRAVSSRLRDELPATTRKLDAFVIMVHPVTQSEYAVYVYETGAPRSRGSTRARDHAHRIATARRPSASRGRTDAPRQRAWIILQCSSVTPRPRPTGVMWGARRGGFGHLPTEAQWERAARGDDGRMYPWGDTFSVRRSNTREAGRGDMIAVATLGAGVSPHGVHDVAGNVAEWTQGVEDGRAIVKGASWRDDLVAARPAARRWLPAALRHVAVGFRCVLE